MKFLFLATTLAAGALAQYKPCPNQTRNHALCCNAGLVNVINFDCHTPLPFPTMSGDEFKKTCASTGSYAKCCTIKLIGNGILCEDPVGIKDPSGGSLFPEGDNDLENLLEDVVNILGEVLGTVTDLLDGLD